MSAPERLVEPANYRPPARIGLGISALLVYFFWALLLISQKPGLQYDEALHVAGAVHMLHGKGELPVTHQPHSWVSVRDRWFPLMALSYTGAVKDYFCLPLFAVTGPRMSVIRVASMLLGAAGIWGLYILSRDQFGPRIAAAAAFLLAANPAYIHQTVFDTSAVGTWMAAFGLLCWTLNRYLQRAGHGGAVLLGFAAGFAVWTRANFLWLLGSVALAALLIWRRRLFPPLSHTWRMALGAVLGASPFLVYQIISKGGTWKALDIYEAKGAWIERIHGRLILLSETFLSDREHRTMWAAAEMPAWQSWLLAGLVVVGCCICLIPRAHCDAARRAWARTVALSFLFLTTILLASRLEVSEHHLVVVLPIAALIVVLAGSALWARGRIAQGVVVAIACIYGGLAFSWNQRAYAGLAETGGVGLWSDAAIPFTQHIERYYSGRGIKILDWGFQLNLFVLSSGRVVGREIFWEASEQRNSAKRTWRREVGDGGIYLLPGPTLRSFPAAAKGFLAALDDAGVASRRFTVAQRNGDQYAVLVEIQGEGCSGYSLASRVSTGDPLCNAQMEGFHQIEQEGWRWSAKEFAAKLGMPARRTTGGLRLVVVVHVPDALIRKLGPITLTASVGDKVVARQVYQRAGSHQLSAPLDSSTLDPQVNTFRFALDKCVEPSQEDKRQLGVIVSSIALEAQ